MTFEILRVLKKMERRQRRTQVQNPPNIVAPWKEYTIASGVITLTGYDKIRVIIVDTQGDAATDDLDTINGGAAGDIIICKSAADARVPTFKDATGNLYLAGDFALSNSKDTITLVSGTAGTTWIEVSRSDNA